MRCFIRDHPKKSLDVIWSTLYFRLCLPQVEGEMRNCEIFYLFGLLSSKGMVMPYATHLYLIVFREKPIIKIGKAKNVHERIQCLKHSWGAVDYVNSYQLLAPQGIINHLEKSLHIYLGHYRIYYRRGIGKTEIFSREALRPALELIEKFCTLRTDLNLQIKKGIEKTSATFFPPERKGYIRLRPHSRELFKGLRKVTYQFHQLQRWLFVLWKKQERIPYQYDIQDNYLYFRIVLPRKHFDILHQISELFWFPITDFNRFYNHLLCEGIIFKNEIIQYKIKLMSEERRAMFHPMVYYLFQQTKFLFDHLPQRSPATLKEIPLLNESGESL